MTSFDLSSGCFVAVGGRKYQEDRITVKYNYGGCENCFFAVYDGHGGSEVSTFLSETFHQELAQHPKFRSLPISALQDVWIAMDDKCYEHLNNRRRSDGASAFPFAGSTATVCYMVGSDIYITNCGDSTAYCVMEDGRMEIVTENHGTNNLAEVKRCEAAGGEVKEEKGRVRYCCFERAVDLGGKPRVYPGGLLVTRAFGDFYAKKEFLGGKANVVISQHGKISYKNLEKTSIQYIIIASDGIWDVLDANNVMQVINDFNDAPSNAKCNHIQNNKVHAVNSGSTDEERTGDDKNAVIESELAKMIAVGTVTADENSLNMKLCRIAKCIVEAALSSHKWRDMRSRPDNTSCIVIQIDRRNNNSPSTIVNKSDDTLTATSTPQSTATSSPNK